MAMPAHPSLASFTQVPSRDPLWYKDAVIYELHVRAFADSNGDGIGDFPGLISRLDYLQDLGITAIWLLPFYPSPLRDDGYDIADYTSVHPAYGTLADFERFLDEAHRRGLRVITELVINHTSDQHPWFQRARRAPAGSPERDFYVWSDDPSRFAEARIIFKDFETSNWTWDPMARSYFWHRFYSHQPDLNFDNQSVWQATFEVLDFWLSRGVDGLRLDAVPYLFEREGTNCENLPPTHDYLKALRRYVDERYADRMLLAEANQWPEDAAAYFGTGEECHMNFHFPLMPRLFMAVRMEDRFPILDILQQTPAIPESCQWAIFLRNHDELTLEMVTDEDRDYMYRVYAQDAQSRINLGIRRRLAPLLENHRPRIELLQALLLSLPGTPVLYYGDEIGMGDNIYLGDRHGCRTPMQWTPERNAGFSRANPQRLYLPVVIDPSYHFESVNVEAQQNNAHSLLWWNKRLLALRKRFQAFGRGTFEVRPCDNAKVLAFVRRFTRQTPHQGPEEEILLVVANLSRHAQAAEIDLAGFEGLVPTELLGRTPFPLVATMPYRLTLGGHGFYWFRLEHESRLVGNDQPLPLLALDGGWEDVFEGQARGKLEELLTAYSQRKVWFNTSARSVESAVLQDVVALGVIGKAPAWFVLFQVRYREGEPETYQASLAFMQDADPRLGEVRHHAIGRLRLTDPHTAVLSEGVLIDATAEAGVAHCVLLGMLAEASGRGAEGAVFGEAVASEKAVLDQVKDAEPLRLADERVCSAASVADQVVIKIYRRLEAGVHPEVEMLRYLAQKSDLQMVAPLAGVLVYQRPGQEAMTLATAQRIPAHHIGAWQQALDALGRFYERALTRAAPEPLPVVQGSLLDLIDVETPEVARELIGPYLERARSLGQRTATMHHALASGRETADFVPEPSTTLFQRSQYQSLRTQARQTLTLLRRKQASLAEREREDALLLLEREEELLRQARRIQEHRVQSMRIRTHGNYHLGQFLFNGKDFVLYDLAGDPTRHFVDRRRKRSALRDVAGMLYSFHFATWAASEGGGVRQYDHAALGAWARYWRVWVSMTYLSAYLEAAGPVPSDGTAHAFLPPTREEMGTLLHFFLLKRAAGELRAGLSGQEKITGPALRALLQMLDRGARFDPKV